MRHNAQTIAILGRSCSVLSSDLSEILCLTMSWGWLWWQRREEFPRKQTQWHIHFLLFGPLSITTRRRRRRTERRLLRSRLSPDTLMSRTAFQLANQSLAQRLPRNAKQMPNLQLFSWSLHSPMWRMWSFLALFFIWSAVSVGWSGREPSAQHSIQQQILFWTRSPWYGQQWDSS